MNIFQWLAGADQEILDQCSNSEKNKITGFGTLVIIPAIIGIFSMTYAVSTITDNVIMCGTAGVIWFFVVLFIDRFIVSTLYKSKLEDKTNFFWAIVSRYAFALFVGIAVAHPMTLLWFDQSISEGIEQEAQTAKSNNEKSFLNNQKTIRAKVLELEEKKACLEKLYTAEQSGHKVELECGYSSGLAGNSERCEKIQKQIDSVNISIDRENERIKNLLQMSKNQRDADSLFLSGNISFDYLARVRMLSKLEKDKANGGSHIWSVSIFMILFFIFIDILPITLKVTTPYGEYEAIRDSHIQNEINRQNAIQTGSKTFYECYYATIYEKQLQEKEEYTKLLKKAQFYTKYYETFVYLQDLNSKDRKSVV